MIKHPLKETFPLQYGGRAEIFRHASTNGEVKIKFNRIWKIKVKRFKPLYFNGLRVYKNTF
jgi:hypothetical protein